MQSDPRLLRWLAVERRHFWLFHGGGFVAACGVGLVLIVLALGWLGLGWVIPHSRVGGTYYGARGGAVMIVLAGAWLVMLGRWAAWLWRDGWPLARLEPAAGARILATLIASETAVPRAALDRVVGRESVERFTHLRGVVRLAGPPPALSLDAPLRRRLAFAAPAQFAYEARAGAGGAPRR